MATDGDRSIFDNLDHVIDIVKFTTYEFYYFSSVYSCHFVEICNLQHCCKVFAKFRPHWILKPMLSLLFEGGRHHSDRLCSDRRYSDSPQSRRPSTSLASLGIFRNSRNWKKKHWWGSRCCMHRKHGIDWGTEAIWAPCIGLLALLLGLAFQTFVPKFWNARPNMGLK